MGDLILREGRHGASLLSYGNNSGSTPRPATTTKRQPDTMSATALNLTIEQGATLSLAIALGAATWDGQAATAVIRSRFGGTLVKALTCSAIAASAVTISLTAAETALLTAPASARNDERDVVLGYWELLATTGGTVVTRLRQGTVTLSRQVSA